MKTVLVSGAGVAGLATAYWLRQSGYEVTVIERADSTRLGGQPIDVRGPALDVVDRMGVLAEVRAARTHMRGMSVVDADGAEIEQTTDWTVSTGPLDLGDVELLRDDLVRLMLDRLKDVDIVYSQTITALVEEPDGLNLFFARGKPRRFDLVVGADGLYSNVRELMFGPDEDFLRHLGIYLSVCTSENFLGLDNWQLWHTGESAGFIVFPVRDNAELRITLTFQSPPIDYSRDPEQQKALVADRLAHLGGSVPQMIEAMRKSSDFYFVPMAQVMMDHWSKGRAVLVGDAGYCASPLSGQGTSVALVGAYVLADELKKAGDDYGSAFTRYEERMRPFVKLNQAVGAANAEGAPALEIFEQARSAIELDP